MERHRPSPLQDVTVFHSGPPTLEAGYKDNSEVPVRNTFIDFSEHQIHQPITAPGKFVGRLAGPATVLATPANGTARAAGAAVSGATSGSVVQMAQAGVTSGTLPPSAAPPPPMQSPRLPADAATAGPGPAMPPMMSPHLPPEYTATISGRSIPPPPQASPTVAGRGLLGEVQQVTQVQPAHLSPPPEAPRLQAPALPQGTVIEVKSLVQASSPPRFCPPAYSINFMQTPTAAGMPPPMYSPVCATPGTGSSVSSGTSRCFRSFVASQAGAPAIGAQPVATPAGVPEGMVWPATPF